MARYLLVDDRTGRILGELASARQAAGLLARMEWSAGGDPPFSLVVLESDRESLARVKSLVTMRPFPVPPAPRRRAQRAPDRPIDRR